MTTIDDDRRAAVLRLLTHPRTDRDIAHEIYHEDAVLEFPQSGERFEGVHNFREWRSQYPADMTFEVRRITGSGDVWMAEAAVSYHGGPWILGVSLHEFRGDRVAHERIYVTEPWDAPAWRAP